MVYNSMAMAQKSGKIIIDAAEVAAVPAIINAKMNYARDGKELDARGVMGRLRAKYVK